jgi:hypothetical protein
LYFDIFRWDENLIHYREIDRLKSKVAELEQQLVVHHARSENEARAPTLSDKIDPLRENGGNKGTWEYVYIKGSKGTQCFGPSSSVYFATQLNSYLEKTLATLSDVVVEPDTTSSSLHYPKGSRSSMKKPSLRRGNSASSKPLTRWQEEDFLNLFWHSYHLMYPLVDEQEFWQHHRSIWITPWESRKPSALVDILLAVSMQYGTALPPPDLAIRGARAGERAKDAATAGRSYYRRCQAYLADELENPSITNLQCYLFSVIYLSNAGMHSAAHGILAIACRMGSTLGIHREAPHDLEDDQRNLHRRLWWTVCALEIKNSMELGRPFSIGNSQVFSALPTSSPQMGTISIPGEETSSSTGSSFDANLQFIKLMLVARSVYITFYNKSADLLGLSQQNDLYGSSRTLEESAEFLRSTLHHFQTWVDNLPSILKPKRRENGEQLYSNDSSHEQRSMLSFAQQRQQLFLELHYHTVMMNLFRPFIFYSQSPGVSNPQTEWNASSCVNHAIIIINLIHENLTASNLLVGWVETLQWLGNAFLSLVGYTLAYPEGQTTMVAREAILKAIQSFNILSETLSMAASSSKAAQDLVTKAELLVKKASKKSSLFIHNDALSVPPNALVDENQVGWSEVSHFNDLETMGIDLSSSDVPFSFELTGSMDWTGANSSHEFGLWDLDQDADPWILPWTAEE